MPNSNHSSIFSGLAAMREDIPRSLAWKKWKTDVTDICFETNGLLASLFSEEDCERLFQVEVIVPLDPGQAGANLGAAELVNHKARADKFRDFEGHAKELRSVIMQLPVELLRPLQVHGSLRQRTVREIFSTIDLKLSALLQKDFDSIESRLAIMWDSAVDTESFLAGKIALFEDLEDAGQPKAELDKVNTIIKCLPQLQFQRCVESFFEKYASVSKQTVTRLCKHVNVYAANVLPRATRGVALSVGNPLDGLSDEAIDRLASALEARLGSKSVDAAARLYCWTHGPCNHLGKDCTSPQPGHKVDATMTKKMGGAELYTSNRKRNEKRKKVT